MWNLLCISAWRRDSRTNMWRHKMWSSFS